MAEHVKTRTVVPKAFASASEVDPSELPRRLEIMQEYLLDSVEQDCRKFARTISEWRDNQLWQHFSDSWELFVRDHIKQPLEWINYMLQGVDLLDKSKPIKASDAINAGRQRAIALAESEIKLNTHGGDRKSNQVSNNKVDAVSNSVDAQYLAARIARDAPEVHEEMKQGKYLSVRAAAVAAGIVKPRIQFTVGKSTSPESFAESLKAKLDEDFIEALKSYL